MAVERVLTLRQVLDWNDKWSYSDREFIERAITMFDKPDFRIPPSGGYIRVRVGGRIVCGVGPGYVWWPRVAVAEGLDPSTIPSRFHTAPDGQSTVPLSTWVDPPGGSRHAVIEPEICPVTFLQHPLTGECDDCR